MTAQVTTPAGEHVPTADQRLVIYGAPWSHVLRQQRYERTGRSSLFPDLDLELLCSFLELPTALQAVKAFREALRR